MQNGSSDFSVNRDRTAQFAGTRIGNPGLQEETSDSWTTGVVLQPRFLPGLTATVD